MSPQDPLTRLVLFLQSLPPEVLWPVMLAACFSAVLALHRFFGEAGLYAYVVVAILGANIQVLKAVKFAVYQEPVALGTVMFASSFLATDILSEHYGTKRARAGVLLGLVCYLIFTIFMILTLGFAPLTPEQAGEEMAWAIASHEHLTAIFSHSPALFGAGMIAYLLSQLHDVWLFERLKQRFAGRHLWLRNTLSTAVSAFLDNLIFSLLAWIVFAADPLPLHTVFWTYVVGTYWLRLIVAALDTPFVYLARRWSPR
ncbi:MAG: queuosine precursor transporter [Acidobacteriota bacterium]